MTRAACGPAGVARAARLTAFILVLASSLGWASTAEAQGEYASMFDEPQAGAIPMMRNEAALGFVTGAHRAGYTLTSVTLALGSMSADSELMVYLWPAATGGTLPKQSAHSELLELTPPARLLASSNNIFTASPGGAVLAPDTRYFVLLRNTGTDDIEYVTSVSSGETASPGWSIDDRSYGRARSTSSAWGSGSVLKPRMRVDASRNPAPAEDVGLDALALSGVTLEPAFDPATLVYTAAVAQDVVSTTVTATPATGVDASISPADDDSVTLGHQVALSQGSNRITVTVSKAGSTGGGYTVTVTRAPPPTITIEANQTSMGGGLQDLVLTLTRTGATTDLLDVTVEIAQDEAWLSALSHDVTFAAGSATATLTFLDSDFSLDPTMSGNLTATVAAVTGYDVSGAAATVEVIAIDGPPVIVRFDRTAYRFPEGGPAENVEIYLVASLDAAFSMPPVTAFNIRVSTRRGTATSPDDFSAVDQVLRIGGSSYRDEGDGTLVARLPVASTDEPRFVIVDDDVYEDDETLSVLATSGAEDRGLHANARVRRAFADHGYREHNLALPAYARMQRADGTLCESAHTDTCTDMQYPVTITDEDDLPELSLAVWPAFIAEEDDTRTPDITENVSVVTASTAHGKRFASDRTLTLTFAGTASALTHYALAPADEDATTPGHQVTLPARATEVSLTVTATPNDTAAGARTIIVAGSREGRAFGTEQIVTIGDDETSSAATGAPTISGTAQADETLKADISGIADANGLFGVTFSYQWIRVDGTTETDISDETSATYTLAAADVDKTIKVRVSFTDEGGSDEALTSAATATIIAALPGICGRTAQVKDAVVAAITGVADCADVTASHLAGMTQLGINGDLELTSLRVRDFAGLSSLRELKLIRNGLSSVPAGVFAGLSSLRELRLSSNQLSSLPGELFADIPSLRILYLNNNKFDTLEAGVFAELSSLHELYLHSNKFASLKAGVFAGLSSLRQLYLNGNKFASLDAEVFDGLSSVEILWLHENRLNSLPAGLFAGLSSLDRLELNDNELTTLPAGLFTGLSSLRRLYLNDNQLTDLPEDLSNELSSLRILKLRRNSFDCLPDNLVNRTSLNVDITVANFSCPTVTLSLAPASIEEMDDPDTTDESENMATVTATLSAPSSIATTVTISAVPDSPAVEADYVLSTNTDLTVAADTTTSTGDVTITAVDNMILTGERAVTISGAASNARVKVVKDAHLSIEDDEANTALTALTLSDVTLEPSFDSVTTDYVVTDANTIESTTVTATAQSGASAVIAPVDADADAPGHQVALSEGDTTITVTVSKAGSVDVVYTVTVTRQAPATGEPTITGTLRVGEALSADTSDITDANGLGSVSYTYQWVRVDGATETDISGATAATYTLTTDDLGKTIKVDVSFTDDAGHAQGPLASAPAGPVAPGRVADVALTPGVFSLAVGWTAVDGAEGYKVQWRSGGEVFADAGTTGREHSVDGGAATSATIAGLTAGVSHTVRVLATHGTGGDGPASEEAMETPLAATLAIADAAVAEASGAKVTFEVTLSAPAPDEVTVSWSTGDDTDAPEGTGAVAGEDYTAVSSETVRLGAGELSAQIEVAVLDDAFDEHDETFAVTLSGASHNAKLGDATATGTLTDDDAWPAIAPKATTYAVDEGDSVEFVIVLDPVSGRDVTVAYETVAGTAEAGDDYTTVSGTVTFKAGETEKSIPVTTLADAEDDDGETFSLRLSDPVKATLETALAQATIAQVTAPRVTLVLTPDSIRESDDTQQLGEEHVSTVTATVSPAHDQAFTVTVTAAPVSSAVAGDFTLSTNTTLSFAADAGDSTGTVTITAVDNAVHNDDRTVTVSGTASASGVAAPADVTVTIDNEDMRGVTVSVTTLSVPEGGDAQYTVVLDTQPTGDVTVTPALAAGGDTDLTLDSTAALTFTATNWNTPQSVQVNARADTDTANGTATIEHTVAGADVDYASVLAGDVTVTEDDVTTAPCTVDTSGRVEKWSGELTVASHSAGAEFGYGLGAGGALSETDFTIGTSTHTIDTVQVGTDGTLNFGLDGSDDFRDYERDALVLHVCADAFVLKNRDGFLDSDVTYSFNSSGLDWSAATTVSLALSIPANTVATGAPAISGTVQVGEVLTAGAGDIADDDGLGSDVSYSYQWVLVDSGTAADIAGATAATYTVAATHEGKTLKVRASFEDRFGNAETRTSIETAAVTGANAVPAFAVTSETITVDESVGNTGTATSTDIGTALPPATDDDAGDSLTYSLEGTDAASFELDAATRQLKTKTTVVYDFEATPSYSVTLKAQDPAGASATLAVTVDLTDVDEPPLAPDQPDVAPVTGSTSELLVTWTAPDSTARPGVSHYDLQLKESPDGDWVDGPQGESGLSATISGLEAGTLYEVQVRAVNDEGDGAWSTPKSATTYANNAPIFSSSATFSTAENSTEVGTVIAMDADADDDITEYAIVDGVDEALFTINASDGVLAFATAPDFESPQDSESTTPDNDDANNEHIVVVRATSGAGARVMTKEQTIIVTVTNVDEQPEQPGAPTVSATAGSSTSLDVSWSEPGLNNGPPITGYDLQYRKGTTGGFTDGPQGVTGASTTIGNLEADTSYQVQVRAQNGETPSAWSPSRAASTGVAPQVTLVLDTDSIAEKGGVSTVTATVTPPHASAFTVTVSAVAGAQTEAGDFTLSTNTTLSFAADAGDSTGTVTITAVDNAVHNDDRTVTVSGTASASGVAAPADVTVTIDNEDMRGVTVSVTTLSVPEGGDAQYTVVLDTQPTGDVTVTPALAAGGDTDLTLDSTAALTFTATNWNTPQSVQVNARADTDTTDGTASVTHAVSGADYAMVSAASVAITESDSGTANTAPVIDTESPIEVDEQTTTVATLEATDAEGNTLSWLTKGGADVNKFNLTGEGVLAFNTAPSYENPVDTDMDNAYVVNVRVSDGTATADLVLTVNVVNVDEQPDQPATSTVSATPGSSTSLDVSWSAPGLNDGPAITQYDLQYRKGTSGGFTDGPQDVTGTSSTLAGLEPNTLYQVQVRAKNGETPSEWSEAGDGTTTAATPVEGQDLSATGMFPAPEAWGTQDYHGAVALCWTPPGMSPGDDFEPDSYEFRYRHYGPGLAEYRNGGGRTAADFRPWRDAPRQHPHATAANRQHMTPCNGGGGIGFNDHVMIGYEYTYQIRATRTSDGSSVVSDAITGISYNPDKPLHTTIRTVDEILEEDALEPDGLMALVPNPVPESMGSFVAGLCFANGQPLLIHCGPVEGFDIAADLTLTNATAELAMADYDSIGGWLLRVTPTTWGDDVTIAVKNNAVTAGGMSSEPTRRTWQTTTAMAQQAGPAVTGTTWGGDTDGDGRWSAGEAVEVHMTFDRPVTVSRGGGTPAVTLLIAGTPVAAAYARGSDTTTLVFGHTLTAGSAAVEAVLLEADSLTLNGGGIAGADGTQAALKHAGAAYSAPPRSVRGTLTAAFEGMPGEHDGSAFGFKLRFSEAPAGLSFRTMRNAFFTVTGGAVTRAKRIEKGSSLAWRVTVEPSGFDTVRVSFVPTLDCAAAGAVCTQDGRPLMSGASTMVLGPAALSVADAEVREAADAVLAFAVTLDRAAGRRITVDYATADGSATAGADYTQTSGTLVFAVGERAKTVNVPILDDAHDEGAETLTLRLANATGARIADGEATGTIVNSDAMPRAWLVRFGRTVAEQVLDAVEDRIANPPRVGSEVRIAGVRVPTGPATARDAARLEDIEAQEEAGTGLRAMSDWLRGEDENAHLGEREMTERDLLSGTSFAWTSETAAGGTASLWGRGALSRFTGREDTLRLEGEVATGMVGADWTQGDWTAGVTVGHSLGDGSYRGEDGRGTVESALTGLYPYGRYALNDRVTLWGAAGYASGSLTLTPDDQPAMETGIDLAMAGLGLRGVLMEAPASGGPELAATADAMGVRTTSAAVRSHDGNLAASQAQATRLRLGLEGTWRGLKLGGGELTPTLEAGVRHDGGDAETGFGLDLGGALAWSHRASGIAGEVSGRGLLTHEAGGFRDRGMAGELTFDPRPQSERGMRLTLRQTMGAQAAGGMDALLGRTTLAGLSANDDGNALDRRRLELRTGYGFAVFSERFTSIPELGLGLSDSARDVRLGWRLVRRATHTLELGIEATRHEPAGDRSGERAPEHAIGVRLDLGQRGPNAVRLGIEATRRERANDDGAPEHALRLRLTARW